MDITSRAAQIRPLRRAYAVADEPPARSPAFRAAATLALVAAGITAYQLSRPGVLFGLSADVSEYFGGAVRLVQGAVPYRDFVFVQPPGFALLSVPIALLSDVTGTRLALALMRLTTPLLAAISVLLVGLLIHRKGTGATVMACSLMALYPAELYVLRGPQLEPVEILFCLTGLVLAFDGDRLNARKRMVVAGLFLGFACAIKLPALLPAAVLAIVCLPDVRHRLLPYLAGALAGFAAPVLPFLVLAPSQFFRDVIAAQLTRGVVRTPGQLRLGEMSGISTYVRADPIVYALTFAIVAFIVSAFALSRRRPSAFEVFVLTSTALLAAAQLIPTAYYPQYPAILAPFLGLSLGVAVARLCETPLRTAANLLVGIALLAMLVNESWAVRLESTSDVAATVDRFVPAGVCTMSDTPDLLITSDRFTSSRGECSRMTDPFGTYLVYGFRSPAALAIWRSAFLSAGAIVSMRPITTWGLAPPLVAYVRRDFRSEHSGGLWVYRRTAV